LKLSDKDAKVDRKDIFVEVDYMVGHKPLSDDFSEVIDAFANAPLTNGDDLPRIKLHIEIVDADPIPHRDILKV